MMILSSLKQVAKELVAAQMSSFVRFVAIGFDSLEQAKNSGMIDYVEFIKDVKIQRSISSWWRKSVKVTNDQLYRAHAGTKLSMLEIFKLNLGGERPIFLLEDDSKFLTEGDGWIKPVRDALEYLEGQDRWHLLYVAFREEEDYDLAEMEQLDVSNTMDLPPAVRVKKVLGNTAMIVNPKCSSDLINLLQTTSEGSLNDSSLDWVVLRAIQRNRIVVYRTRERLVAPIRSMSSIHGTYLAYKDTV